MTDTSPHADYWQDRARDLNERLAEASARAEALRQQVDTMSEVLRMYFSEPEVIPLWKRIANQRIGLRYEIKRGENFRKLAALRAKTIKDLETAHVGLEGMEREEGIENGVTNPGLLGNQNLIEPRDYREWFTDSMVTHERKVITYTGPWVEKK